MPTKDIFSLSTQFPKAIQFLNFILTPLPLKIIQLKADSLRQIRQSTGAPLRDHSSRQERRGREKREGEGAEGREEEPGEDR